MLSDIFVTSSVRSRVRSIEIIWCVQQLLGILVISSHSCKKKKIFVDRCHQFVGRKYWIRLKMACITNTRVQPRCSCTRVPICRHVRAHMVAEGAGSSTNLGKRAQRINGGSKIRKLANFVQIFSLFFFDIFSDIFWE